MAGEGSEQLCARSKWQVRNSNCVIQWRFIYASYLLLLSYLVCSVLQCYGQCYTQPCSTTFRELISCSATHGYPIAFAGFAAWALTYTVSRGHFRRQAGGGALSTVVAAPGSPNLDAAAAPTPAAAEREPPPHRTGSFGAMFPTQAEQFHSGLARFTRSSLSRRRPPAPVPNETPTGPHRTPAAATADDGRTPMFSAGSRPSSRSENPSWAAHSHSHSQFSPSPMPFESFGIRVFQRLGLEPYFRALEVWVNAVVDRIDDGLVVRVTCLPVAAYSLTYALMVRMRFPVSRGHGRLHWPKLSTHRPLDNGVVGNSIGKSSTCSVPMRCSF